MENATEALMIGFAVAMLVIALSLSISSFSQATTAVDAITTARDRESEYTYVEPSQNLSRKVGIDSVITSIYRAYETNTSIYFYTQNGTNKDPLYIYKIKGNDGNYIETNCIDLSLEGLKFSTKEEANSFLNILIGGNFVGGKDTGTGDAEGLWYEYKDCLIDDDETSLYLKYKDAVFEETLGEYVQNSGASEITKRIITYVKQ